MYIHPLLNALSLLLSLSVANSYPSPVQQVQYYTPEFSSTQGVYFINILQHFWGGNDTSSHQRGMPWAYLWHHPPVYIYKSLTLKVTLLARVQTLCWNRKQFFKDVLLCYFTTRYGATTSEQPVSTGTRASRLH